MAETIEQVLNRAVAQGAAPGLAGAIRLASGEVVEAAAGTTHLGGREPITADTVFWIASFTKAITTAAALQLVERRALGLDDPVGQWLAPLSRPELLLGFDDAGTPRLGRAQTPITLRHLITHTAGLAYDFCHADLARLSALRAGEARERTRSSR